MSLSFDFLKREKTTTVDQEAFFPLPRIPHLEQKVYMLLKVLIVRPSIRAQVHMSMMRAPRILKLKSFKLFPSRPSAETWKNVDESHNKRQTYDREMILEAKRVEVEEEIRLRVDALMREELDILKMVRIIKYSKFILFGKPNHQTSRKFMLIRHLRPPRGTRARRASWPRSGKRGRRRRARRGRRRRTRT